jgi:hypothetical protein
VISFFLASLLTIASASAGTAAEGAEARPQVCILNYERLIHPITRELMKTFNSDPDSHLFTEAVPVDLMNCLLGNYREIILVAHAIEDPSQHDQVSLGYFTRYTDAEKQALEQQAVQQGVKIPDETLYHLKAFLPQIFRTMHVALEQLRASGGVVSVKRIRWMSCLPEQVFAVYPEFKQILDEFGIGLDVAPKQVLMSALLGKSVTGFDRLWLAESAQQEESTAPNAWFFSYIDLKTIGVVESGDAVSLHGKYLIHFHGVALGLASRWTQLYIRYHDLDGMKVGETRSVRGPRLDISVGLGEDFELDVLPHVELGLPSDFNSAGISLGLWSDIEVERLF